MKINRMAEKQILQAIEIEIESRYKPLWALWCAWNSKAMSGDDFADEVGKMFPRATNNAWQKSHPTERGVFRVNESNPLSILLV